MIPSFYLVRHRYIGGEARYRYVLKRYSNGEGDSICSACDTSFSACIAGLNSSSKDPSPLDSGHKNRIYPVRLEVPFGEARLSG